MAKQLFQRRLLLVTGKGGVGKTTIAAALAVAARDRGKNVLLAQLGKIDNIGPIFGKQLEPYKYVALEQGLTGFSIEPYLALHEYLVRSIKLQFVVDVFLENRVIQYLTQAAPGWRELITVGKIWELEQQTGPYRRPRFDLIVVDAPATGHGISFLRVPGVILNTIRFGPIRQHTLQVQKLLLDPARTLLIAVTLPEEMPVNEAIEIHRAAKTILQIPYGATVLNGFTGPLAPRGVGPILKKLLEDESAMRALAKALPGGLAPIDDARRTRDERAAMSRRYGAEIEQKIGGDTLQTPFVPGARLDRDSIQRIAKALDEQIGEP